jgi:hypothetical protein
MKKIQVGKKQLHEMFANYPVFELFVQHAIENMDVDFYVDDDIKPESMILYARPAYMLSGRAETNLVDDLKEIIQPGGWIISPNQEWDDLLKITFKENLQSFPRTLFDSSEIKITHLKSIRKPLPEELKIVPINAQHLEKGMIKEEIVDKFFTGKNFLESGFGFALVNDQGMIHGFALTNYPILSEKEVEVSYRVGYDSFQKYRNMGIGTTLASIFVEEAIKRGYDPVWDAAHIVSAHIAKKLGYGEKTHWFMHHLRKN